MVSNENVCKRVTSSSKDLLGTEKNKTVSYVDRVKIESEKMVAIREIPEIRMYELERISQALTSRKPGKLLKGQKLMVIACLQDRSLRVISRRSLMPSVLAEKQK